MAEPANYTNSCLTWNFTVFRSTWHSKLDTLSIVQLILNLFGVLGNSLLIALFHRHPLGSRLPTMLLKSQATYDLLVNVHAFLFAFFDQMWNFSDESMNYLICHIWHSQFTYWLCVQLSIVNLVLVGLERFVAISYPIYYQKLRLSRITIYWVSLNLVYNFLLASPNLLGTMLVDKCCQSQFDDQFRQIVLKVHSICWFILVYLLALFLLIGFYANIIMTLRRSNLFNRTHQRTTETLRFTRMAFVITSVYFVCVSYDAFAYLIARITYKTYQYNMTWHKLGMFFVSLNSLANPYIYFCLVVRDSYVRKLRLFGYKNFTRGSQTRNMVQHET